MKKTTKILSLILTLVMIVPMMIPMLAVDTSAATTSTTGAWNGAIATSFEGGNGSTSSPYLIKTPDQLAYLAKLINDTSTASAYSGKSYKLVADIDLGGREWTPIGATMAVSDSDTAKQRFKGTLDGDGYSITNFKITQKQSIAVGFFTITEGATIKNLTMQGKVTAGLVNMTTSHVPGMAMVVGAAYSTTFDNVTLYANVSIKSSSAIKTYWVGALTGYSSGSTVNNCKFYGTVETKLSAMGAVVGGVVGNSRTLTLTNVYSDVDVYARDLGEQSNFIGGLIGHFYSNKTPVDTLVIKGCTVTGDISANTARSVVIGGLVGCVGGTPQKEYQKNGDDYVLDADGNQIVTGISYTTGGKATVENNAFDGTIHVMKEGNIGSSYEGLMFGRIRTYEASLKNFFTSSTGTLYNKDTSYTWGTDTTTVSGKSFQAYSCTDKGGHVQGISLASDYGVAVRFTPSSPGLRFNSLIEKSLYNTLTGRSDLTVRIGTLITPTAYVEAVGGFDALRLDAFAKDNGFAVGYIDVPFVPGTNEWLNDYIGDAYDATLIANNYIFSGAISNIAEQNYNRTFSGIGYVSIVSEGYELAFYADYTDSSRSRTVGYVANAATNDRKQTENAEYSNEINDGNPNGSYSPYSATQLETIKKYVEAYDPSAMETEALTIVSGGISNYSIVYPFAASDEEQMLAAYLQHVILQLTGADLPIYEDLASAEVNDNEIVVGCNGRASAYRMSRGNYGSDYAVLTSGSRVLINAKDEASLSAAVLAFIEECFGIDMTSATTLTKNTSKTYTLSRFVKLFSTDEGAPKPLTGLSLSGYRIVYTSSNYVHTRMAVSMRDRYKEELGTTLTLTPSTSS